jgi:hypothetical protein
MGLPARALIFSRPINRLFYCCHSNGLRAERNIFHGFGKDARHPGGVISHTVS